MKQSYSRPQLIEYGRMAELTLGTGGSKPDLIGGVTNTNTNCTSTDTNVTSCNVVS
jgi:hypothetical protein